MQNQINNNEIHCKVQHGDEFRRFLLQGSYASMLEQIRALFSFKNEEELSIKYTDDEGDLVTISSDEELAFAIELFSNSVLRLTLTGPASKQHWKGHRDGSHCGKWAHDDKDKWERIRAERAEFWRAKKACKVEKKEAKRACKGEKWESKRAHWEAKKEKFLNDPELRREKLEHLDYKLKKLQERKQWLQSQADANVNPSFAHRLPHLSAKINRMESFRAMLANPVATSAFGSCKEQKWDSKRACKTEKWESKNDCKAEKWESKRAHWEAKKEKILNDPELRREKLEHLDYKLKKLQDRKQFLQSKVVANENPGFAHRLVHLSAKINRMESFRAMLANPVATSPAVTPIAQATPF